MAVLALSSDGRSAASSGPKAPILIWDLKSGKRTHTLTAIDPITKPMWTAVAFSADARRVMAASKSGTVFAWDLDTKQEQPPITLEAGPIKQEEFPGSAFGSARQHLVTGRRSGPVELWDLESGKKLQRSRVHVGVVHRVACSADGRLILSAGRDNTIRLWDATSGKELKQLKSDDRHVLCLALSPDSRRALSAGIGGPVQLWDLASGEEVCRMEGHTMAVNSVAFSPDGRQAVSGGDDRTVRSGNCRNRVLPALHSADRDHLERGNGSPCAALARRCRSQGSAAVLGDRTGRSQESISNGCHSGRSGGMTTTIARSGGVESMQDFVAASRGQIRRLEPGLVAGDIGIRRGSVPKVSIATPARSDRSRNSSGESTRNAGVRGE